jgi:5-methylcytosine-specific restriction protein A
MGKITLEHIKNAYEIAKKFNIGELSLNQSSSFLINLGMNQSSAQGYIYTYVRMIEGKPLTRTINSTATEYYLERIWKENGPRGLKKALSSLSQHFEYYEKTSGSAMASQRKVYDKYSVLIKNQKEDVLFPDELDENSIYTEGQIKTILVNGYERNRAARKKCIEHYGTTCQICHFNFEEMYGEIGAEYIHVHHKIDISTIGKEYSIDPLVDLIPVCPNCHSMLHMKKPAFSVEELKNVIASRRASHKTG